MLRAALAPLAKHIEAAFIYGPGARHVRAPAIAGAPGAAAASGAAVVDVMVVGTALTYVDLIPRVLPAEKRTGCKISLCIYTAEEFSRKLAARNIVIASIVKQPKIFLLGSEQALAGDQT